MEGVGRSTTHVVLPASVTANWQRRTLAATAASECSTDRLVLDLGKSAQHNSLFNIVRAAEAVFEGAASTSSSLELCLQHGRLSGSFDSVFDEHLDGEALLRSADLSHPPYDAHILETGKDPRLQHVLGGARYNVQSPCKVAVGGTFDRMHAGHRLLLTVAALTAGRGGEVYTAVAPERMLSSKTQASLIEPLSKRMYNVENYLRRAAPSVHVHVDELQSPVRGIRGQPPVDALVVSIETASNGYKINAARAAARMASLNISAIWNLLEQRLEGLKSLAIVCVRPISGQGGNKLSSSALRSSEMSSVGPKDEHPSGRSDSCQER